MKNAIFITGFNNWGKSTLIRTLFNRVTFYPRRGAYSIPGINNIPFDVYHTSNDDPLKEGNRGRSWLKRLKHHYQGQAKKVERSIRMNVNLISALCPTKEPGNDFTAILNKQWFNQFDNIYIFLILWKWDRHAQLTTSEIQKYFRMKNKSKKVKIIIIRGDKNRTKLKQVKSELTKIFR